MPAQKCFSMVRGRVMRITRLDSCGRVKPTGCSSITSEGFVSIAYTANLSEGEAITVTNAGGKQCINEPASSRLLNYSLVFTFCEVDPELYAMMTGQAVVYNTTGEAVGFRVNSDVDPSDSGFAVEVWSNVPGVVCGAGATAATYGYTLNPFVQGGVIGDFTLENAAVSFVISGATTKTGGGWGTGPYNVIDGAAGAASKLATAIGPADHLHVQLTNIEPPTPGCSCLASGPAATGATAGTPGTWTPVDSYPRKDLADLIANPVTASPTTAWTAGQYIVLQDGSHAKWNATAWVVAP